MKQLNAMQIHQVNGGIRNAVESENGYLVSTIKVPGSTEDQTVTVEINVLTPGVVTATSR